MRIIRKHNYDNIDNKMLNLKTMYKITIKIYETIKIKKNSLLLLTTKIDLKHLIGNFQFFVFSFINRIDIFTFSIIKFIFKMENINQLI